MKRNAVLFALLALIAILAVLFASPVIGETKAAPYVTLPTDITEIGSNAFAGNSALTGVYIPRTVTKIGEGAFAGCPGLTLYGWQGTAAETYADQANIPFVAFDVTLSALAMQTYTADTNTIARLTATASAEYGTLTYIYKIYDNGTLIFESEETTSAEYQYTIPGPGTYTFGVSAQNGADTKEILCETSHYIERPIGFAAEGTLYIALNETVNVLSASETRAVTLTLSEGAAQYVSLDAQNRLTGLSVGAFTVYAETEDGVKGTLPAEVVIPVSEVHIANPLMYMNIGAQPVQLRAAVTPDNATHPEVTWRSEDPSIAAVSETGLLSPVAQGTVQIIATAGDKTDSFSLTVRQPATTITVTSDTGENAVYMNEQLQLSASILPLNADIRTVTWSSSLPSVATVDENGLVQGVSSGTILITAAAKDGSGVIGTIAITVRQVPENITISVTNASMFTGNAQQATATVLPASAYDKTLLWTSSDESIATVSSTGYITAHKRGSVTITATAHNGVYATKTILVQQIETGVTALFADMYIAKGAKTQPYVFVKPADTDFKTLTWTSDSMAVSVNTTTGEITGVTAGGAAVITGVTQHGYQVRFNVHVIKTGERAIAAMTIKNNAGNVVTSASVYQGQTYYIKPVPTPSNATYMTGGWYSENESIATVSGNNSGCTITAVDVGTVKIWCVASSGAATSMNFTVLPVLASSVSLNYTGTQNLEIGSTRQLTATVLPANTYNKAVAWSSSNPGVAIVSPDGLVSALAAGDATITAVTSNNLTASVKIHIEPIRMTHFSLIENAYSGIAGSTYQVKYSYAPSNASLNTIIWYTQDANVATVNTNGLVTLIGEGETNIIGNANNGSGPSVSLRVSVDVIRVDSMTITRKDGLMLTDAFTMNWNQDIALNAAILPANASFPTIVWTSNDPEIVEVTAEGVLRARSAGTATVTASVDGARLTRSFTVTVTSDGTVSYRALIVGEYTVPSQSGFLPFSANGTTGIRAALSRSAIGGQKYSINALTGSPNSSAISGALGTIAAAADENDVTFIYILTHGTYSSGEYYMQVSSDGKRITGSALLTKIKEIPGEVVLVLCTCYSGHMLDISPMVTLMNAAGAYTTGGGLQGRLSVICSSTNTKSSYYDVSDITRSYDFYTRAVARGLGWDMLTDTATGVAADANGDGIVTVSELAGYSKRATVSDIQSYIANNGLTAFNGNVSQTPRYFIHSGGSDVAVWQRR